MKLRDVIARLNEVYSSAIGVEYMHIWDHEQVNWIREQIETPEQIKFTKEEKLRMLAGLGLREAAHANLGIPTALTIQLYNSAEL